MRMSKFRQRLEYKCLINGIKIEIVNEAYTSKVCSKCGNYKKELKGEKVYERQHKENTGTPDMRRVRSPKHVSGRVMIHEVGLKRALHVLAKGGRKKNKG